MVEYNDANSLLPFAPTITINALRPPLPTPTPTMKLSLALLVIPPSTHDLQQSTNTSDAYG